MQVSIFQIATRHFVIALALISCCNAIEAADLQAENLFDSTRLLDIDIRIEEQDWETLCKQSRGGGAGGFFGMLSNTTQKPFTYFKGDITIDGVKISDVGIRKKGFIGSLDETRPSLKVKFSEYVKQKPVNGLDRLTLNNNKQDTALVSQFLSYKVFNDAGVHAPRVSFAKVTVNGEYLGIYSNVESVKKPFLKSRYNDDTGNLYEGTLADFYPKALSKIESKTDTKPADDPDVARLAELLSAASDLPMDEIDKLVDVDNFLKFWAVESVLGFWDGYTQNQNNYFVYDNPVNGKFYFVPWGADSCFSSGGGPFGRFGGPKSAAVRADAMLPNRLYHSKGISDRYKQTLLQVLKDAWDEEELVGEVDRIEKLTKGLLHADQMGDGEAARWGGRSQTMDAVREFVNTRREEILTELEDWPVKVLDQPRKPGYTVDVGSISGTLATHWSEDSEVDDEGSVSNIEFQLNGKTVTLKEPTIAAHPMQFRGFGRGRRSRGGPPGARRTPPATVVVKGKRESDGEPVTITFTLDKARLSSPHTEPISVSGSLNVGERERSGFGPPTGEMLKGELTLSKSGTQDGAAIAGDFDVQIFEMRGGLMERFRGRGGPGGGRGGPGRGGSRRGSRE